MSIAITFLRIRDSLTLNGIFSKEKKKKKCITEQMKLEGVIDKILIVHKGNKRNFKCKLILISFKKDNLMQNELKKKIILFF